MTSDSGQIQAGVVPGPTDTPMAAPKRPARRSRLVPGVPRRHKGEPEPWAVQALRGLTTVGVALVCMLAGFLAGVGLAEITGWVEILMLSSIAGIAVGSLFAQRAADWIMDWIA